MSQIKKASVAMKRSFEVHPVSSQLSPGEFRKALPHLTRLLPRLQDVHRLPLRIPLTTAIRRRAAADMEAGNASTFDVAIALLAQVAVDRWAAAGRPAWSVNPLRTAKPFPCKIEMVMDAWLYVCEFAWFAGCDLGLAVAHLAQIETGGAR